jgi:hypothetical protein
MGRGSENSESGGGLDELSDYKNSRHDIDKAGSDGQFQDEGLSRENASSSSRQSSEISEELHMEEELLRENISHTEETSWETSMKVEKLKLRPREEAIEERLAQYGSAAFADEVVGIETLYI